MARARSNVASEGKRVVDREDFQWAFGLNRLSLDMIGIWPSESSKSTATCCNCKNLRIPFMVLWMLVCLFLPQMYALTQVYHQLPLVVDNLTTSCAALTSSIKLFLLWNSRQVLRPIIDTISVDWLRLKTPWEHEAMIRQARRARAFTISGYAIMFVCFVGFITSPFFGLSIRIVNNITDASDDGRFFPLQTYYPFETGSSPYFELTYVTQLVAGSFVGISFSVPDNFFGALVFHASAQCEILGEKMKRLLDRLDGQIDGRRLFRQRLRRLVDTHVHLLRFVDAVEASFNLLILAQVLCLSVIICCLGFGVIQSIATDGNESPPIVQVATLAGTLLNLMIHMLVYCIASEILAERSLGFSHAVYSSKWYSSPAEYSRDLIPIMIRSKFPVRLTAGKFFSLSLNAYLMILKTSGGYISMLLAVSGD